MSNGYRVTQTIVGAHPIHQDYPLYEDDILTRKDDGSFFKESPGLGIAGFWLTEEQITTLEPIIFKNYGLHYRILDDARGE